MPALIRETIEQASLDAQPDEACGLLIGHMTGTTAAVARAVVSRNVAPAPRHKRFEIDPALQLKYQRELRGTDTAIIGHFHSHPNGLAVPSDADRDAPGEDGLLWLIAAIQDDRLQSLRAFFRHGGKAMFSEWSITE